MNNISRWARLLLAVMALLFAGIIYAWSFLKVPLAELYGWEPRGSQLQLNYTLTLCFFCLGGVLSGLTAKFLSPRVRMLIGAVLLAAGLVIVSQLDGKSALMLYLGYGGLAGAGIGFVYNVIIATTNAWFPDRKGLASGSMMLGFGFSAMILGNLATALFQTSLGWRGTFLMYGIVIGAILALISLIVRVPKPDEIPAQVAAAATDGIDYDTRAMLKRPSFWLLFAFCTILGAVGSTAIAQSGDFMREVSGNDTAMVALGASLIAVMNGAGRLIAGTMFDNLGLRRTQIFNNIILVLAPLTMLLALSTEFPWIGVIGLGLSGFAFSFSPTVTATFSLAFFGRKNFPLNFPVLTLTLIPASFAATLAGSMSFSSTYIALTGIALLGAIINLFIKKA